MVKQIGTGNSNAAYPFFAVWVLLSSEKDKRSLFETIKKQPKMVRSMVGNYSNTLAPLSLGSNILR